MANWQWKVDLTIHGVTPQGRFHGRRSYDANEDPWPSTRLVVSGTTKINRKDYGLTWNAALETDGILVGEEITIALEVEFAKA